MQRTIRTALGEHSTNTQRRCRFLADDESTERDADDHLRLVAEKLVGEPEAGTARIVRVLQKLCALHVLVAVQTRRQNEVTLEKRAGFAQPAFETMLARAVLGADLGHRRGWRVRRCGGNLVDESGCSGGRIGRRAYGATDDEIVCPVADRRSGCRNALLIVV